MFRNIATWKKQGVQQVKKTYKNVLAYVQKSFVRLHNMLALGQWGDFPGGLDSKESTCNAGDHLYCK